MLDGNGAVKNLFTKSSHLHYTATSALELDSSLIFLLFRFAVSEYRRGSVAAIREERAADGITAVPIGYGRVAGK